MAFQTLLLGQKVVIGGILGTCIVVYTCNQSTTGLNRRRYMDAARLVSSGQASPRAFRVVDGEVQVPQSLQNAQPSFAPRSFFDKTWTPKFVQQNLVLNRTNLQENRWYTLLTSGFSHANLLHLSANLLGFYSMAPSLIAKVGTPAFIGIWVASGVAGGMASIWGLNNKRYLNSSPSESARIEGNGPRSADVNFLGASSSVLGLFATAAVLSPQMTLRIFPIPIDFQAQGLLATFLFGSLIADVQGWLPAIGHLGHAGGLIVGGIAGYAIRRFRPSGSSLMTLPLLVHTVSQAQLLSDEVQALLDTIHAMKER